MATKRKLKADGTTGKCAIYTVDDLAIDDAPFTAPLSNISRVEFHSDLDYLAVQPISGNYVTTGTLLLPPRSGTTPSTTTHNLFAHGLGYQPLVLGYIQFEGYNTPLLGTTPIYAGSDWPSFGAILLRTLQLGADATNVFVHEYVMRIDTAAVTMPAVSLPWSVMVTTRNLDSTTGNNNTVSHGSNLYISPTRVVFGQGKFDTNNRHIKKVSSGGFPVTIGKTIEVQQVGGLDPAINFRWSVNGQARGSTFAGTPTVTNTVVRMDAV